MGSPKGVKGAPGVLLIVASFVVLWLGMSAQASASTPQPRIHGGTATTSAEWPWVAVIFDTEHSGQCTGSLVDPGVVLTAAHCITTTAPNFVVGLGFTDYTEANTPGHEVKGVSQVVVSPQW